MSLMQMIQQRVDAMAACPDLITQDDADALRNLIDRLRGCAMDIQGSVSTLNYTGDAVVAKSKARQGVIEIIELIAGPR